MNSHRAGGSPSPLQVAILTLSAIALLSVPLKAVDQKSETAIEGDEIAVIESESRCVDSPGIAINSAPDTEVKMACLQDQNVRNECNPDGQHARIKAFQQWETALITFQDQCTQAGGFFAYADPSFKEPSNESFCTTAEPEVKYSTLEDPMCNFVSRCPRVQVLCRQVDPTAANAQHTVLLPGIPKAVSLTY